MAIAEMKKITLLAMNRDKSRLLRQMQRLGCVQVSQLGEEALGQLKSRDTAKLEALKADIQRMEEVIVRIGKFDPVKKGLFSQRPVADEELVETVLARRQDLMELVERNEEMERIRGELRARILREKALIDQMRPWEGLTIPLERIGRTGAATLGLYNMMDTSYDQLVRLAGEMSVQPALEVISRTAGVNLLVACHRAAAAEMDAALKQVNASPVQLGEGQGLPADIIRQAEEELERIDREFKALDEENLRQARELDMLRVLRDLTATECERLKAAAGFAQTRSAFLMEGWLPAEKEKQVEEKLKKAAPTAEIEFSDPAPDEKPPTLLVNNKFNEPFETVINLYSLPDPRGIDATALMAPFYILFFGFMVSDAGYGVVLSLLAGLYVLLAKPRGSIGQMAKVIFWGGLGTVFWGIMFGGWFGVEVKPVLFVPLNSPVETMVLCLILGFVHILFGLGIAAYMNLKRRRYVEAIADQGGWFLILLGIPMLLLPATAQIGKWMAIAGVLVILLLGGHGKKNIFKRLIGGAGKLYDVTSYVSDILSYVRLFGMGLATGVIGMVVNLMAGMMMGSVVGFVFAVVVLLVGHTFNLGITLLGAYVNACRLQYIEFFGKFYEGGGIPFTPLAVKTKYVDVKFGSDLEA